MSDSKETKWVSKKARYPFACDSKELAMREFIFRKSRQLYILEKQIKYIEAAKNIAKSMLENK